jgi:hypothetical protein
VVVDNRVRLAFRAALETHARSARLHERAAELYERMDRPDAAAREHAKADVERTRARDAVDAHPDWL